MILVTGGLGFIGLHTACELATRDEVTVSYHRRRRDPEKVAKLVGAPVRQVQLDVGQPDLVAQVMDTVRPDSVVHLAVPGLGALEPAEEITANMAGLVNVLEAARTGGVRRLTIASSVAVYDGAAQGPYRETDSLPVASRSATSAMKKAIEVLALHYADRTGLDIVLLRIGNIYGPMYHSLANVPSRLLHHAVKGRPLEEWPGGWSMEQFRSGLDLCYVKDAAAGIAQVHRAVHTRDRIYNVGSGTVASVGEIIDAAVAAVPGVTFPAQLREIEYRPERQAYLDIGRVIEEFRWSPRFSLAEGMADYARWLADHDL
jgi:UDP-glucose 4-epimerase